jgi:hypothetical protein
MSRLDSLCKEIFESFPKKFKDQKEGILYGVIYILLEEEEDLAQDICNHFNINRNMSLKEDLAVSKTASNLADGIIFIYNNKGERKNSKLHSYFISVLVSTPAMQNLQETMKSFPFVKNQLSLSQTYDVNSHHLSLFEQQSSDELIIKIIVVACVLIGAYIIYEKFINKRNRQNTPRRSNGRPESPTSSTYASSHQDLVSLSLVVQATDQVTSLVETSDINVDTLKSLIDDASYFICESRRDTDEIIQQRLRLTYEPVVTSPSREVYLRIDIDDGQDLKGKTSRYILKRDLKPGQVGRLKKKAYLETLSGLEHFNRV